MGIHDPLLHPVAPSPTNILPVEILGEVFLACLSSGGESQHHPFIKPKPWSAPMFLCQVCSRWRQTALFMPSHGPRLQQRKFFSFTTFRCSDCGWERSRTSPLSFHLTGSREARPRSELDSAIFSTFSSNCQHFPSITFHQSRCDWLWAGDNRSISLQAVYNHWPSSVFLQDILNAKFPDCPSMAQIDSRSCERTA